MDVLKVEDIFTGRGKDTIKLEDSDVIGKGRDTVKVYSESSDTRDRGMDTGNIERKAGTTELGRASVSPSHFFFMHSSLTRSV